MASVRIAILGWGSLIWDPRPEFDATVGAWSGGGPPLPIEFCRVSSTRKGALTLVIDQALGTEVPTLYTLSRREDREAALGDLAEREGTSPKNLGYVDLGAGKERGRDPAARAVIKAWAAARSIEVALWTDLPSNFAARTGAAFSPEAALAHLQGLPLDGLRSAVRYLVRAPPQTQTALRTWLADVPWFQAQVALLAGCA